MIHLLSKPSLKIVGLFFCLVLFLFSLALSLFIGKTPIPLHVTIEAIFQYDPTSTEHLIIMSSRVTRTIIAALVGGALAIAGLFMQALTRNPLAEPGIFGVNAGAVFFVVLFIFLFPARSLVEYMWAAFFGAGLAATMIYFLGSTGKAGLSPVKVVLAGAAVTAMFGSVTSGLLILNENGLQDVLFWMAGSVAGRTLDMVVPLLPFLLAALILGFFLTHHLNILTSGEDVAKGLGQNTVLIKALTVVVIVVLAGGAVAICGAIGFVGLIIPHIARYLVGTDHRWLLPYCALLGASLLLIADLGARLIVMPADMPIGVMTAILGTPFFIYIARKGFRS
ncbi:FecCD family ABC transporter permease [Bacillus horti]|uniref:Iron complex transport system permease protein n=1 Tax=Caldalkalibacillus horti TaxID=77523 RepID=A0ABT9VVL7_9BACI|nr:iron ABC transporter permease [Bacillus horti]MDQ0165031.1 iron complex transport system permease protein [Bacillus horti]